MPLDQDHTDISGVGELGAGPGYRTRRPQDISADVNRTVNRTRSGPQPSQGGDNPFGAFFSGLGSRVRGLVDRPGETVKDVAGDVGGFLGSELQARNPITNTIDWGQEMTRDAASAWAWGRHVAGVLSGKWNDGVHATYAGQDIGSRLKQEGLNTLSELDPTTAVTQAFQYELGPKGLGGLFDPSNTLYARQQRGEVTSQQLEQQRQQLQEQSAQNLPGNVAMDVTLPLGGEGTLGKAAAVGVPTAVQLARGDDPHSALAWNAVGALLSFGHLGGARNVLRDLFSGWDDTEQGVRQAQAAKRKADEAAVDPKKQQQAIKDHVDRHLPPLSQAATAKGPSKAGMQKLVHKMPGEPDFRDPAAQLPQIPGKAGEAADQHLGAISDLVEEIGAGMWATHEDPWRMQLASIASHARSTDSAWDFYYESLSKMLGHVTEARDIEMGKAIEGDLGVYEGLAPAEKLYVDGHRILTAALREAAAGTDYAENAVPNYLPRVDVEIPELPRGRGRPSKSVLAKERRKARATEERLDPSTGRTVLGQKFPTVQATNEALQGARKSLVNELLDYSSPLSPELTEPETTRIRQLAQVDMRAAQETATSYAAGVYPLKNERAIEASRRVLPYQARSIVSQRGLTELAKTIVQGTRADGSTVHRAAAINVSRMPDRLVEGKRALGYEGIDDLKFRNWLFDPEVASRIREYTAGPLDMGKLGEALSKTERGLVRAVMYSPALHGANILRRAGGLFFRHPIVMASYLSKGKALAPAQVDDVSRALRREARQAGVLPPRAAKEWMANFTDTVSSALGDTGDHLHLQDQNTMFGRMMNALPAPVRGLHGAWQSLESGFWREVNDFGTLAFHVEKEAAKRGGISEPAASRWAAERANSWMGMLLPEDQNPLWQRFAKLGIFAPGWWKSLYQLAVPMYKKSGVFEADHKLAMYAAKEGVKTVAAMLAFMKVSGEVANLMMSGHLQNGNVEGHKDDVEITNPAILGLLQKGGLLPDGMDPQTGINANTGGKMYIRTGGQFQDVLGALGYASGQPGTPVGPGVNVGPNHVQFSLPGSIEDVGDGLSKFTAGRLSPLLHDAFAAGNVDLYHTMTSHQLRAEVPGSTPASLNPLAPLSAVILSAPGGLSLAQSLQRDVGRSSTQSLPGSQVPGVFADLPKDVGTSTERAVIAGLLGVNPPYQAAAKSRGVAPSDEDYMKIKDLTAEYDRRQQQLSAEAASGQLTPYRWWQQYNLQHRAHDDQLRALFKNSPEYVGGSYGLANQWQSFYDQATAPDGTTDQVKLAELQAQFRAQHSPEAMAAMQSVLRKNYDKTPMLKLYHDVEDKFNAWTDKWAQDRGLDVSQLHALTSQYNAAHGDSAAQRRFLSQHRELSAYKKAIASQWDKSLTGLVYVLFHGDSKRAMRALGARHLSFQELESQVEAA